MGHITLITGGAKSGKSAFAEQLAQAGGSRLGYIATARAEDEEMRERIRRHQERRDHRWQTLEEPLHPSRIIAAQGQQVAFDVLLLDCLTVLITNILLDTVLDWEHPPMPALRALEQRVMDEVSALAIAARGFPGRTILVSNEVGCGIVPASPLSRFFRDCVGSASQRLAASANAVYLVAAGLPLCLKNEEDQP